MENGNIVFDKIKIWFVYKNDSISKVVSKLRVLYMY